MGTPLPMSLLALACSIHDPVDTVSSVAAVILMYKLYTPVYLETFLNRPQNILNSLSPIRSKHIAFLNASSASSLQCVFDSKDKGLFESNQ